MNHTGQRWLPIRRRRCSAFSLVELLVVIGIIGTLVALLIPAVQASRAAADRTACSNNLRQLGIAIQHYESALGHLPSGSIAKPFPSDPLHVWTFYRWSTLAMLTPYLEQTAAYDALDLTVPLYGGNFQVRSENVEAVKLIIPEFLCPADDARRLNDEFGPTSYAVCAGTGRNGGSPNKADGAFYVNSELRFSQIPDGTSRTVLMSESILGEPQPAHHDPQKEYKFAFSAPISENLCNTTSQWNVSDPRGFAWVNGEYRCTLYNHRQTPNSTTPDCIGVLIGGDPTVRYTGYGWRAARSRHTGGVQVLLADGSVHFAGDAIELTVWRALATVAGRETVDLR
jgi:prepilin-type processing-associated H-X9-DG protein